MDEKWMRRAIEAAESARLLSPPNPWVGSVIVKDENLVGIGWTSPPGGPHAEIAALRMAGSEARGADVYVTLEPCCHYGRTPPCTNALIEAGVKRVFAAIEDPDVKVKGKGCDALRAAGIEVHVGLCRKEVEEQLAPYLFHRTHRRPYTLLKTATSIDGSIAAQDGTSQWITDSIAREDVHRLRALSQAIMVGAGTAIQDRPLLTVRHPTMRPFKEPLRVICDTAGRVPVPEEGGYLLVTTESCPSAILKQWEAKGNEIAIVHRNGTGVCLRETLELLGKRGVLQLLVEGGSRLHSSFIQGGLAQELVVYVGNCLLGGSGKRLFEGLHVTTMGEAPRFSLRECCKVGESSRMRYLLNMEQESL